MEKKTRKNKTFAAHMSKLERYCYKFSQKLSLTSFRLSTSKDIFAFLFSPFYFSKTEKKVEQKKKSGTDSIWAIECSQYKHSNCISQHLLRIKIL